LESVITSENVGAIKAKYIVEMANGPVTPEADKVLQQRGIISIPDIVANAGGVSVSYYEWLQNRAQESWEKDRVLAELEQKITESFVEVYNRMRELGCDMRVAAYAVAVKRVVSALKF
jgi:glutamate dehydrogenase/leucine dehydrogenase